MQNSEAHLIFGQLDPLLRLLLSTIRQNKARQEGSVGLRSQNGRKGPIDDIRVDARDEGATSLLRSQSELLSRLDDTLAELANEFSHEPKRSQLAYTLAVMAEYWTLPLLAVLRGTNVEWFPAATKNTLSSTLSVELTHPRMERALELQCLERAARILSRGFQLMKQQQDDSSKVAIALVPTALQIKCLVACASAIPSGQSIVEKQQDESGSSSLDSSEECITQVLITIIDVVEIHEPQNRPDGESARAAAIAHAMEGALVARIADCCVGLLTSDSAPASDSKNAATAAFQIQACVTLRTLLEHIPIRSTWQSIFPGIYVGLYRHLLSSLRYAHTRSRVVVVSAATLCTFLRLTLQRTISSSDKEKLSLQSSSVESVMARLKALAVTKAFTMQDQLTKNASQDDAESRFFQQVNNRLPATIHILVQLLTTARSHAVRLQATSLDRVVLLDTKSAWCDRPYDNDETSTSLVTTCLESSLVLSQDADPDVRQASHQLLSDFAEQASDETIVGYSSGQFLVGRVMTIFEELPYLVRSRRNEVALQAKIKLISGYLALNSTVKQAAQFLRSTLAAPSLHQKIREALSCVFDVDFETFDSQSINAIVVLEPSQSGVKGPSFRFLSEESAEHAREMVRLLGKALGPKHTALIVDSCIAGMYESLLSRSETKQSFGGYSQVQWVHEWIGALHIAELLLRGCFGSTDDMLPVSRKRSHLLSTLTSSILPIVTTFPVWDLPVASEVKRAEAQDRMAIVQDNMRSVVLSKTEKSFAVAALRANAAFIGRVLDLIRCLIDVLGEEGRKFIPALLYPIVEKTAVGSVSWVQEMARFALTSIASSCGYSGPEQLLLEHFHVLVGTITARLRVPGGRMLSFDESPLSDSVVAVVSIAGFAFRSVCQYPGTVKATVPSMERITELIARRFDDWSSSCKGDESETLRFLQTFDAAACHVIKAHGIEIDRSKKSFDNSPTPLPSPWLNMLSVFREQEDSTTSGKNQSPFRDMKPICKSDSGNICWSALARDADFVARLLDRCCFLLSHPSLKVQILACDSAIQCFRFLGWLSSIQQDDRDDSESETANGPRTAILRQVHSCWPAISSRLKATTIGVSRSPDTSLVFVRYQSVQDPILDNVGEQRVLLSKIFNVMAVMTECAGDFMATRIRDVVWPCMGRLIGQFMGHSPQPRGVTKQKLSGAQVSVGYHRRRLAGSERNLLISVFNFLKRVYDCRASGVALAPLIPQAGTMIFPFLEDHSPDTQVACMEAIKSMIRIDGDALLRSLLELSGGSFPPSPFREVGDGPVEKRTTPATKSLLALHCAQLVDYLESLPEQRLD